MGSIKLEIIEANTTAPWCTPQHPPQITGIAFRPTTSVDGRYLAEVDVRGVPRSDPEQFQRGGKPAWTNVYFSDFISTAAGAFVCDFHLPEPKDLALRRRVLENCRGGRLGVVDAVKLVITSRDTTSAGHRWQRLFDPLRPAPPLTWRRRWDQL